LLPWSSQRGLENVHEHLLRADAGAFAEQLRHPPEQRFLLFHGAGVEHRDLDIHEIIAPGDAKIRRAVAEVDAARLCVPKTLSVLIGGGNHLTSAHNDRAAMLCP
jgi:hypothetical protein